MLFFSGINIYWYISIYIQKNIYPKKSIFTKISNKYFTFSLRFPYIRFFKWFTQKREQNISYHYFKRTTMKSPIIVNVLPFVNWNYNNTKNVIIVLISSDIMFSRVGAMSRKEKVFKLKSSFQVAFGDRRERRCRHHVEGMRGCPSSFTTPAPSCHRLALQRTCYYGQMFYNRFDLFVSRYTTRVWSDATDVGTNIEWLMGSISPCNYFTNAT